MGDLRGHVRPCCCRPTSLLSFVVVAFEKSDRYVEAAAVTVVAVPVLVYVMILPGLGRIRLAEQWAAGHEVDRASGTGGHLHLGSGGGCPRGGEATLFGPPCYLSLSVRSLGRPGRGWSSTGFWAPSSELPIMLIAVHSFVEGSDATGQGRHRR